MVALKYRLSREIVFRSKSDKRLILDAIHFLFGQDENNKDDMIVHNILSLLVEKLIIHNGSAILRQNEVNKVDFIINRKVRDKIDISTFKNNERLKKRVNLYYGEKRPKSSKKEGSVEEKEVYETFNNYVANDSYIKTPHRYEELKGFIVDEYSLDKAISIEIVDLGVTRSEVIKDYFITLLVDGMNPLMGHKYLSSALCNVAIDVRYKGGNKKRINLYVRDFRKNNSVGINLGNMFLEEDIFNEDYSDPRVSDFMKFFNLNTKLFSNTFNSSVIEGDDLIAQEIDIDIVNVRKIFMPLLPYSHYCDVSGIGLKQFKIDRSYFHRATNLIEASAIYVSDPYVPYVKVKLITETYYCLVRISGYPFLKVPRELTIDWALRNEIDQHTFFDY